MCWHERVWHRFRAFGRSLRWEIEHELVEGYRAPWANQLPVWAKSSGSDIVGTWRARRRRLTWFWVPIGPWRRWPS